MTPDEAIRRIRELEKVQRDIIFDAYCNPRRRMLLTPDERRIGEEEWARRLREKIAAAAEKERHQVVCDPMDLDLE